MTDNQKETLGNIINFVPGPNRDDLIELKEFLLDCVLHETLIEELGTNGFLCYPFADENDFCVFLQTLYEDDIYSLPLYIYSLHTDNEDKETDNDKEDIEDLEPQFSNYYLILEPWNLSDLFNEELSLTDEDIKIYRKKTIEYLNSQEDYLSNLPIAPPTISTHDRVFQRFSKSNINNNTTNLKNKSQEEFKKNTQLNYLFKRPDNLR